VSYLKNRWVYALTAMLCSLMVIPLASFFLTLKTNTPSSDYAHYDLMDHLILTGLPAAFAALICWPTRTVRTRRRMFWAGILTVILTFMLMPLSMAIGSGTLGELDNVLGRGVFMLTVGSVITFGLPYVIAIIAAQTFADFD